MAKDFRDTVRSTEKKQPSHPNRYFIVRARTEENPHQYYFASIDGGFVAWTPGTGPLHRSLVCEQVRPFSSRQAAQEFIGRGFSERNFCYIEVEPAGPSLDKYFASCQSMNR